MRVALDMTYLVPGTTGGRETYARSLLAALRRQRPDWQLTTIVPREAAGPGWWADDADDTIVLERASGISRPRWVLAEQVSVPRAARDHDLLHSTGNFAPARCSVPQVVNVHDAMWLRVPDAASAPVRALTTALVKSGAAASELVITGAEAAKHDLVGLLDIDPAKIRVIPNGVAVNGEGDRQAGRQLCGLGSDDQRRLVLSVSSNLPHKNLVALAAAAPGIQDALVCFVGAGTDRIRGESVLGLGAVDAKSLEDLYAAADVVALPTRYEGFGLPVLEAMARNVPVACSDIAVLQEVGGGAVSTFDSSNESSIAETVNRVLAGGPAIDDQVVRGHAHALKFTWDAHAAEVAECYESVARG